jgi:hypothetical protein
MLDPETIDGMSSEEQTDLLAWLEDLVKYVRLKLGRDSVEKEFTDPVGDIVLQDHKDNQAKAMSGRKPRGWLRLGFGRVDDKHV